jgi:PAS domain S-box-containing protein
LRDHWHIFLLAFTLLVMLFTGTVYVINLNFKLKKVGTSLRNELQERQEAEEGVQRLSRRNQLILETVGEGIIGIDMRGRAIFVNPAAAAMTGYAQDELINQEMHQILHHCKSDGLVYPLEECPIEKSLKHGTCCRVRDEVLWRKDGTNFPVTYLSAPIIEHSEIVGAVVTFDDITDIKEAELALRESEREREKEHLKTVNLESLGYLAGGIAHDFNNFLTAILGSVSLVIETIKKVGDGEELHQILMQAEQATLKARSLAQQLLTFAKGGAPDKQPISLPDIVKQVASFACVGSSTRCEFIFPANLWAVEADPDQLSQLINNLAINAVQAMPGGGIITIRAHNLFLAADSDLPLGGGRYVEISIQDQGTGIAPENQAKIFAPYFTTKESGSGLGLASAFSIITKHGGYIKVDSVLAQGTTFYLYLPASEKTIPAKVIANAEVLSGSGRILILDDEELVRETIGRMITHLGYEPDFAKDGLEAIEIYADAQATGRQFNAVIMDLTIPGGMGGKEAMKRLLLLDPSVKGIVSSGYADDPIMAHYKDYGFCGVIKKPYRISTLSKVLSKCLL